MIEPTPPPRQSANLKNSGAGRGRAERDLAPRAQTRRAGRLSRSVQNTSWQLQEGNNSAPRPVVLILVAGLMRSFRATFHGLRHSIIEQNSKKFKIEIIVSTDLSTTCSDKDFENGCCIEPLNQSSYKWAGLTSDALARQAAAPVRSALATPSLSSTVFFVATSSAIFNPIPPPHRTHVHLDLLHRTQSAPPLPTQPYQPPATHPRDVRSSGPILLTSSMSFRLEGQTRCLACVRRWRVGTFRGTIQCS